MEVESSQTIIEYSVNFSAGHQIRPLALKSVQGDQVLIPDENRLTHLQFRRFAGCPTCNLHIRSFARRYRELTVRGIQEVIIFHSSESMANEYFDDLPFPVVADPTRTLAKEFGVKQSIWSITHRIALVSILKGIVRHGVKLPERLESVLNLPADFLIGRDGRIIKAKRGKHAYDQWNIDQLIELCMDCTAPQEREQFRKISHPLTKMK